MGQRSNCSKSGRLDMDPLSEDSEPPSSSDSDDTVEDETYEIDPTDLQSDEEEIEYDTRAKEKGKIVLREEDNEAESVDGDLDNVLEDTDFSDEEDTVSESGDSVECGDHIREELQYDAEELIFIREMNRNLRRVQHTSVGPFTTNQVFKEAHAIFSASERVRQVDLNSAGKSVPLDHRDSDEEGLSMNDGNEDSEVEHEAVKTKEGKRNLDYPFFNEQTDMRNVYFEVGLRFQSQKVLKEAILWYSIQQKKDIRYITDTDQWIILCCHGCTWEMFASRDLEHMDTWKINDLGGEHGCVRAFDNKLISASWLTEQFLDKILRNPKMTPREMKDDIQSRYDISVHVRLCRKAKNNALSAVTDLMKHQYGILKPYLRELCISNPGTHCVLKTSEALPGQPAVFQKCYVCFDALRKGFVEICRPIIGVDGCFLKHACGGQLLFAVGRDGNNHMYPVAWAVVEAENRGSWEWFLKLVGEDLNIGFGGGWTVISDQKKGLVESIHALWPNIEHRRCARYVFSDWVKLHKGRELEQQFWRCVKATAMGQFTAETDDLKKLSKDAYDDFMVRDPNTFCKFHFKTHSKCDVVDNNMAETFNSFILLARYKPIITMFEDIRLALMNRMKEKKEKVSKFVAGVPPRISEKLEEAYEEQKNCECRWNGDNGSGFEVLHKGICHAVDLEKRTCSCRVWELTGIPCCHAMNAILYMNKKPEDYIAMWYKVETYAQTYSMLLQSARGNISWDHDDEAGMVLPPSIERRGCGRRNTDRRTDVDECSIKTSPSKVKHDDPRRKQSRSDDSESSTMKRAKEVQAKLSAEYPSFIKCIIHSHTKRRGFLNIPAKFCHEHLPKCNANLELVAKHGKTFSVKYLGNRHLLTAGWNDFSSAHKLDKGDVLVGQLVNKASFQVEIHIIRHNVLAETDGDLGLLEVETRADVTISSNSESSTLKRAEEVQAKLSAEYPSFSKCIIHSYTKHRSWLSIPAKFSHEHLPKCNANLELVDKRGKTFSVKYLGNRYALSGGWNDFSRAHKLEKGDFLVGQLVNKALFQVAIHIIRHNVLAETDGDLGLLEVDTRADVTISSNSESSTLKRAEEVQAKLSAEYPSFSKCIIHSYTKHRSWLSIPAKFCHKHLPKCNANLELVDKRGKTFSVKYLGNKHALTAGWNDFSSAHKLEKGDFLVGQLVNKALFQVEIHIIRHNVSAETDGDLGLLGSDTYADVMISNDDEKNSNAFAKAQEKHLDRLLPCSSTNILENPDYMPPELYTDEMLKSSSWKRHLRSSKYAQQAPCKQPEQIEDEYDTADPSSLKSTSMIPDPVLLQATDMKSTPVRPQASSSSDPVSLQATIDKTPKHRSCKVQLQTCQKATRNKPEQIENEYSTADFHFSRSRKRRRANPAPLQSTNTSSDPGLLRGIEMCSVQFGDHLERIWMSFPADKLVDFSYLECLWFMMYRETCHRTLVLSWIKKKNIFSRKYIFVPICIWGHWNLLILCHFGESVASESKKPFMLLLDSLHKADPMRYGPEIRKFVMDIFKEEGISYRSVSKIRLLVPKVPQQKNKECGYFTLYYMKKFIEATLETVSDDDLTFINENWFSHEELDGFCMESKAQELLHSQEMALDESSTDGDVICLD